MTNASRCLRRFQTNRIDALLPISSLLRQPLLFDGTRSSGGPPGGVREEHSDDREEILEREAIILSLRALCLYKQFLGLLGGRKG
jgi:hypothetical protein